MLLSSNTVSIWSYIHANIKQFQHQIYSRADLKALISQPLLPQPDKVKLWNGAYLTNSSSLLLEPSCPHLICPFTNQDTSCDGLALPRMPKRRGRFKCSSRKVHSDSTLHLAHSSLIVNPIQIKREDGAPQSICASKRFTRYRLRFLTSPMSTILICLETSSAPFPSLWSPCSISSILTSLITC